MFGHAEKGMNVLIEKCVLQYSTLSFRLKKLSISFKAVSIYFNTPTVPTNTLESPSSSSKNSRSGYNSNKTTPTRGSRATPRESTKGTPSNSRNSSNRTTPTNAINRLSHTRNGDYNSPQIGNSKEFDTIHESWKKNSFKKDSFRSASDKRPLESKRKEDTTYLHIFLLQFVLMLLSLLLHPVRQKKMNSTWTILDLD